MHRILSILLLASLTSVAAPASEPVIVDARRERVLIPVAFYGEIPGAHGSMWRMELTGFNDADVHVAVTGAGTCGIQCSIPPAATKSSFTLDMSDAGPGLGWFYYVERPHNNLVHFSLRTRDVSREMETWGTEIPIVREDEVPEGTVHLIDVPLMEGFRSTLRIYDMGDELNLNSEAVLRAYSLDGGALLVEKMVALSTFGAPAENLPAQASLVDFGTELPGFSGPLRLEIEPTGRASRLWAFVSITHNETQHVTIVTPQ